MLERLSIFLKGLGGPVDLVPIRISILGGQCLWARCVLAICTLIHKGLTNFTWVRDVSKKYFTVRALFLVFRFKQKGGRFLVIYFVLTVFACIGMTVLALFCTLRHAPGAYHYIQMHKEYLEDMEMYRFEIEERGALRNAKLKDSREDALRAVQHLRNQLETIYTGT